MAYPNVAYWSALRSGRYVRREADETLDLSVLDCGWLTMPTGRLVACDPFTFLQKGGNAAVAVEPGRYRVLVTLADVSGLGDGSHMRTAYATLLLDEAAEEIRRAIITPRPDGSPCAPGLTEDGEYDGFPVDSGTACFTDDGAIATAMPDEDVWLDEVFDSDSPECWFERMDDPAHLRDGLANIALPLGKQGENIVIFRSGWGDGAYPVIGGYDASGRLVRVHIDFMIVSETWSSAAPAA